MQEYIQEMAHFYYFQLVILAGSLAPCINLVGHRSSLWTCCFLIICLPGHWECYNVPKGVLTSRSIRGLLLLLIFDVLGM